MAVIDNATTNIHVKAKSVLFSNKLPNYLPSCVHHVVFLPRVRKLPLLHILGRVMF